MSIQLTIFLAATLALVAPGEAAVVPGRGRTSPRNLPFTGELFTCEGKPCGVYEDPRNCGAFFICDKDKTITNHRLCQHGTLFRTETMLCDRPEFVSCRDRPRFPAFSCDGKECGMYADDRECAGVYICKEDKGVVEHKFCEHNLHFNKVLKVCDLPEYAHCEIALPALSAKGD